MAQESNPMKPGQALQSLRKTVEITCVWCGAKARKYHYAKFCSRRCKNAATQSRKRVKKCD